MRPYRRALAVCSWWRTKLKEKIGDSFFAYRGGGLQDEWRLAGCIQTITVGACTG
jgi:hypothetical protein